MYSLMDLRHSVVGALLPDYRQAGKEESEDVAHLEQPSLALPDSATYMQAWGNQVVLPKPAASLQQA